MTDIPETDTLKGLLAQATRGPWTAFDWDPPESDGQQVFRRPIGSMRDATTVANVLGTTSGLLDGFAAPIRQADANARLIALAPILASRVIEQGAALAAKDARIARLKAALALLTDRSAGLVHAHHHGNGLEGWYDKVDGVDRAITVARGALEDVQ